MTRRYKPSNGTEGSYFMANFCDRCERDREYREKDDPETACDILTRTLFLPVGHRDYPDQWTYDEEGSPVCTAFVPEEETIPKRCDKTVDMFNDKEKG